MQIRDIKCLYFCERHPTSDSATRLVASTTRIGEMYKTLNKNVYCISCSHEEQRTSPPPKKTYSSFFHNSRLKNFGKSRVWARLHSNCVNHHTTKSTVLVVSCKLHLLHAPLVLSNRLIHLIGQKCLNFEKQKLIEKYSLSNHVKVQYE